jgi:hypothetical protein
MLISVSKVERSRAMDGRLWEKLYREVRLLGKKQIGLRRVGRPQTYGTDEVLLVWLFAAMMNWAVSVAQRKLREGPAGWWLRRHWEWSTRVPSLPTLTRRARAPDFRWMLRGLLRKVRAWQARRPARVVVMDATLLLTGPYSRDPESRWTCHGGKWFRGYALHAICDEHGILWAWHVTSANVQEMKVGRRLIRQLAILGKGRVRWVVSDSGYDSEPLHQLTTRRLRAALLAPINTRGAKTGAWRKTQPGRAAAERTLATAPGKKTMSKRCVIEQWNGWFKGTSGVSMLPHHARRLHRVRLWINLKLALFFAHQSLVRRGLQSAA